MIDDLVNSSSIYKTRLFNFICNNRWFHRLLQHLQSSSRLVRLSCTSREMTRTGGGFGNEDGESVSGSKGGVSRSRSNDGADFSWSWDLDIPPSPSVHELISWASCSAVLEAVADCAWVQQWASCCAVLHRNEAVAEDWACRQWRGGVTVSDEPVAEDWACRAYMRSVHGMCLDLLCIE